MVVLIGASSNLSPHDAPISASPRETSRAPDVIALTSRYPSIRDRPMEPFRQRCPDRTSPRALASQRPGNELVL